ncbi:MAG: AI-2E family transporter [Balneolaceae bacterium]
MFKNLTIEKILKLAVVITVLWLIAVLLYNYANLVAYAIIAMFFSYALDPIVNRMQASGMNRTLATTITLSTVFLVVLWISTSVIPIVAGQMAVLFQQLNIDNLKFIAEQIENKITTDFEFVPPGFLMENLYTTIEEFMDVRNFTNILGDVIGLFTNIFSAFLVIPFATFFFLKDGSKIRRQLLTLVPNKYFETTLSLIDKIESRLGFYFRSVLVQCTLVGIFSWFALMIAGLNNAVSVGIAIGIANSIPYFGPIMGYILSIVIAIIETGDFSLVLPCILAVLSAQILDNVILQPLIFSKSADIHPVAILFIILIGAQTAGLIGMLVAIPIATIIKITVNQVRWSINNYHVFAIASNQTYPEAENLNKVREKNTVS